LQTAQARIVDATTARSDGRYNKLSIDLTRLQRLTESISLYAAVRTQLATTNLDVSEKMGMGGASAVRAYAEDEAYVDQGVLSTLEVRWQLPNIPQQLPGQFQLIGFVDSATGRFDRNPWSTERNRRTLSGAGLGLTWFDARHFAVRTSFAHKLGSAEATSASDSDSRFWVNAVKYF
jgi:hemolysin activation/secretion protein